MSPEDPLAALRDIHTPPPVSWWPPAPGWWLLALLAITALFVLMLLVRRVLARRRRRARVAAQLDQLVTAYRRDGDGRALCAGISVLLKRVALAAWPRHEVAGLTGEAWLAFLDDAGGDGGFSSGPGRVLASAGYGARETVDGEALAELARRWIQRAMGRVKP